MLRRSLLTLFVLLFIAVTFSSMPAHAAVQDRFVANSSGIISYRGTSGYTYEAHVFSSIIQYSDSNGNYNDNGPYRTRFRVFFTITYPDGLHTYRMGGTAHIERTLATKPCEPVDICTYATPFGWSPPLEATTTGADIIFNGANTITVTCWCSKMSMADGVWFTFNDSNGQVVHVMDNYGRDFMWCSQWWLQLANPREDPGFCTPYLRN
jgi:hypothetical protein